MRQPLRTAKFEEIGRRAGGGLRNDDLLIASKVRSNRFTDDKWRPHKFRPNFVFLLAARHSASKTCPLLSLRSVGCGTFGLHLLGDKRWIHLLRCNWYKQGKISVGDANHFHLHPLSVSAMLSVVKMWHDEFYFFISHLSSYKKNPTSKVRRDFLFSGVLLTL